MRAWRIILLLGLLLGIDRDAFALRAVDPEKCCTRVLDNGVSRARYYSPQIGRLWTQDDGEHGDQEDPKSLHLYTYCESDPVNNIDPSGHEIEGMLAVMNFGFSFFAQITAPTTKAFGEAVAIPRTPARQCRLSQEGLQLIARFEGFSSKIYKDSAGKDTIGHGHRVLSSEQAKYANGITPAQGLELLRADAGKTQRAVGSLVTAPLNQFEYDALVSFTFNVGAGKQGFGGSTLLSKLNQLDYEGASNEFPKWIYVTIDGVKTPVAGQVERRRKERILFRGESWLFRSELGIDPY